MRVQYIVTVDNSASHYTVEIIVSVSLLLGTRPISANGSGEMQSHEPMTQVKNHSGMSPCFYTIAKCPEHLDGTKVNQKVRFLVGD